MWGYNVNMRTIKVLSFIIGFLIIWDRTVFISSYQVIVNFPGWLERTYAEIYLDYIQDSGSNLQKYLYKTYIQSKVWYS
jgi:hypothetical protein